MNLHLGCDLCRCEILQFFILRSHAFTLVVWIFSRLWTDMNWKWLGLTSSHRWCEFFCNYDLLFHTRVWSLHTRDVNFSTTVNFSKLDVCIIALGSVIFTLVVWIFSILWTALVGKSALYFCIGVWLIHTGGVNYFTSVNDSDFGSCVFYILG